uniref:Peptidase metallopeptidase domain-containing protein n=1 Tax=Attheya septentrionalis TaxID=420275 RepID=A0A6T7J2R8_9STRA|mmetsp:Transcript_28837/g.52749  ORF Transcript_28837/g.52749 Transcript_28837/m.52749 type:complete len:483 (+) Transcript_28837:37-1485(+)|eukprot:CAMPEP_0198280572 /NCGR_PEP_ID=MMETSP1449-20131203/633_1 /TAXON_ID=420275 /ORGANISM="Attheya septentrionalis, Strain CCMP2084" /LENGTH=482 /DNA_ID=CAMNT_0043975973 /DNA_START=25 /DNA_END=1473 /DNA_ORIENTATION=-
MGRRNGTLSPNDTAGDEALARTLQQQYQVEVEFANRSSPVRPSAPPQPSSPPQSEPLPPVVFIPGNSVRIPSAHEAVPASSDAFYENNIPVLPARLSNSGVEIIDLRGDDGVRDQPDPKAMDDEEYARKVEQELADQAYAERLQQVLTERYQNWMYEVDASGRRRPKKKCTVRNVISLLLTVGLIGGSIFALLVAFNGRSSGSSNPGDWINFWDDDPFAGADPEDPRSWKLQRKEGLTLDVLNALDNRWQEFFDRAMFDWSNSSPSIIRFTSETVPQESACSPKTNRVKVCNADYGIQDWTGLNIIHLNAGYIVSSTVKMNDHFFKDGDRFEMQYTMCHEMGHACGLTHTDENFNNKNLGNCMDYTSSPESNMQPDDSNFAVLLSLYGSFPTGSTRTLGTSVPVDKNISPDELDLEKYSAAMSELLDPDANDKEPESRWGTLRNRLHQKKWRLLHESKANGKVHGYDLGGGHALMVHKILAK